MTEGTAGPIGRTDGYFDTLLSNRFEMASGDPARPIDQSVSPVRCFSVQIQNHPDSAGNMLVGNIHNQSTVIAPGQCQTVDIVSLSIPYVISDGTGAITVNWLAYG